MTASNFRKALARVLVYEGGNDDDPHDPGGRTSRGILQREYNAYRHRKGAQPRDVWTADQSEIEEIYRANYWDRAHCDELPAGVDLIVFDSAVNSGIAQAAKWVQRTLGVEVDGDFGPVTREAAKRADALKLIEGVCSRRLAMLQGLKTWRYFGKGWSARVANVRKISVAWANQSTAPDPVMVADVNGNRKADVNDVAKPMITVSAAQISTAATGLGTGATQAATQVQALSEAASWIPYVKYALGGLLVLSVIAGIVAVAAEKIAQAKKDGSDTAEVPIDADLKAQPVAVNDNEPVAAEGAA